MQPKLQLSYFKRFRVAIFKVVLGMSTSIKLLAMECSQNHTTIQKMAPFKMAELLLL